MANDLSWQQLSDQINVAGAIQVVEGKVVIDPSKITGDNYVSLTGMGVIEFVYKLLGFCQKAQTVANSGVSTPNRLASLGITSYGSITETTGAITTSVRSITVQIPLNENEVKGMTG